jgi:type I restriction enzyme S subunit
LVKLTLPESCLTFNSNETHPNDLPVVIFGDHTRILKYINFPFVLGADGTKVLKPLKDILPLFAYYELLNFDIPSAGYSRHFKFLKELSFRYPPLAEQQRIADLLARADRLRRLRRYARQLGDTYLQSVFVEMFGDVGRNTKGWERAFIDDVVAFSQYGTSNKSNSEKRGHPVLGMVNITYDGRLDLESLSYVELSDKEFKDLRLERGDIIFNRTNSTELVGKTVYWNFDFDAVIASYLVKLKLKNNVLPEFFVALLNSPHYKNLFQARCKKAVGQSNVSPTLLKEFPVIIPPLAKQERFARVVARVECLRALQAEAERQAEMLFQSLLAQSFGGE